MHLGITRIVRAVLWRTAWLQDTLVLCAGAAEGDPAVPAGYELVRAGASSAGATIDLVRAAMAAASEDPRDVESRLGRGDECFGWRYGNDIVGFGWATRAERRIGGSLFPAAHGRVYLYNFHSIPPHRGRGLYPALLLQMRAVLGREGHSVFVIDVDPGNVPSVRGIEKAGFQPEARMRSVTLFRRAQVSLRRENLAAAGAGPGRRLS